MFVGPDGTAWMLLVRANCSTDAPEFLEEYPCGRTSAHYPMNSFEMLQNTPSGPG